MKSTLNIIYLLLITMAISCSSSDNDIAPDSPPDTDPTPNTNYNIKLIEDSFEGKNYVVIGSEGWNFMVAYNSILDNVSLSFEAINGALPIIMSDNEGSRYNIFGEAIDGPNSGKKLTPMNGIMGYWFSWAAFYPGLEIFNNTLPLQNFGESVSGTDGWLVPKDNVFVGALRDAIPAIEEPEYHVNKDDTPTDILPNISSVVVGIKYNGTSKLYPHNILNWHEIINDKISDYYYSIIFCPLTGTATVWNRKIDNTITTFGVSGLLYNNNVMPYDRKTNSIWSQMLLKSVQGELTGTNSENYFVLETNYETWIEISKDHQLMNTNTGYSRDYSRNPYGTYPSNSTINFPVNFIDTRLHPKERVLGVIVDGKAKAYRFSSFN